MKLYNLFKRTVCLSLSTLLIATTATNIFAATTKTYQFSDISTQVDIPSDLVVFTRTVSSADPNLDLINASYEQLQVTFKQYGIYLEAVPKDVSYEIVVSGSADNETVSFNQQNSSKLNEGLQDYKALCQSVDTDDIYDASIYTNQTTSFYVVDSKSITSNATVYIKKYYTVMNGNAVSFTIQSNGIKLSEEQSALLQSIVDSAQFNEIKASITDSSIFTELLGTVFAIVVTIGILAIILFFVSKSTTKKKNSDY